MMHGTTNIKIKFQDPLTEYMGTVYASVTISNGIIASHA